MALASLLAVLALGPSTPSSAAEDPTRLLERLVDLPTPEERQAEARRLAGRAEIELSAWLAAAAGFGSFAPLPPGPRVEDLAPAREGEAGDGAVELYVPPGYDPARPAPLLLFLSARRGSGEGGHRPWQGIADELGILVLSPPQPGEGYGFTPRERGRALAALRWARRRANVDENRIFVAGESCGGHAAWDLALRHPDLFAGLFPLVGAPRLSIANAQNNMRYVENVAHLVVRDLQGAKDDPGLLFNVRLAFERLREYGAPDVELVEFPDLAHGFDLARVDWKEIFARAARDPAPDRVVLRAASLATARSHWVVLERLGKEVAETFTPQVKDVVWKALDEDGRRRELQAQADERTARLEVRREGAGRYAAEGEHVGAFRILRTAAECATGAAVEVRFAGRTVKSRPRPAARLLLEEFAERFDRSFLPVAEVQVGR
ncbi:MAG: hypothetical protein AB1726_12865 [Planctomycetota bacterium]